MDVQLRSPPGDVLWFPALREKQTTKTWATRGKTNNTEGKKIQTPNNHCLDLCLPNGFHSVCFLCRKIEGCTWQWNKVQAYRPLEVWGLRPDVGVKWVGGGFIFFSRHMKNALRVCSGWLTSRNLSLQSCYMKNLPISAERRRWAAVRLGPLPLGGSGNRVSTELCVVSLLTDLMQPHVNAVTLRLI